MYCYMACYVVVDEGATGRLQDDVSALPCAYWVLVHSLLRFLDIEGMGSSALALLEPNVDECITTSPHPPLSPTDTEREAIPCLMASDGTDFWTGQTHSPTGTIFEDITSSTGQTVSPTELVFKDPSLPRPREDMAYFTNPNKW